MPFTAEYLNASFGSDQTGIATVGYTLKKDDGTDSVARTTTGVVEEGGGVYGVANVTIPDDAYSVLWDTGGGSPEYASEDLEPMRLREAVDNTVQTNLDATVSSRSSHSAADVWAVGSRTLTSFGTLVADIWSYSTRTLTAFSAALALGIWDVLETAIVAVGSIGLKLKTNVDAAVTTRATQADILSDGTPFPGANIDAAISSRSSHTPANVDTQLSGTHGAGSWESATERDWTDGERNQIRDALGVDGTKVTAVGGQLQDKAEPGDDMALTTAAIQAVRLEIMSYIVNGNSLSLTFEQTVDLIRKAAKNRLEQADGLSNNLVLYDDDNATPFLTWSVTNKTDGAIDQPSTAPAKRSVGV